MPFSIRTTGIITGSASGARKRLAKWTTRASAAITPMKFNALGGSASRVPRDASRYASVITTTGARRDRRRAAVGAQWRAGVAAANRSRRAAHGRLLGTALARAFARRAHRQASRRIPPYHHASSLHLHGEEGFGASGRRGIRMVRFRTVGGDPSQHHGPQGVATGVQPIGRPAH